MSDRSFDQRQRGFQSSIQKPAISNLKNPFILFVLSVAVLIIVFYLLDIQASWDSSVLTLVLNIAFVIVPALFITLIAIHSFMRTGVWPVLWMGIGLLTFGLAAVLSNWLRITSPNNATTVYSLLALLAGIFNFFAGFFSINRISPKEHGSGRLSVLIQVYLIALAFIISVAIIGGLGLLPPFVISGEGTPIRMIVQVTGATLFLLAGLMLFRQSARSKFAMLSWYSLGLLLICLSMVGAILQKTSGSPISWTARGAQYFAGSYLFISAMVILREARAKKLLVDEALADQFAVLSARLKDSEDKYRRLFETMNEGFILAEVVTDAEGRPVDYRFLDVNSAGERYFGRPRSEIVGRTYRTLGGEKADPQWIETLNRVAITGEPVSVERYASVGNQWVHLTAYSPQTGRFAAIFESITESKKAEETLKESQALLQAVMDGAIDPVYVKDRQSRILLANPALASVVGKPLADIIGKTDGDYYGDDAVGEQLRQHDLQVMESGSALTIEETVGTPKGPRTFLSSKSPYRNATGDIIGIIGISHDITDRKEAEDQINDHRRLLETVVNSVPVQVNLMGGKDLRIRLLNPAYQAMEPSKEMIGKTLSEVWPEATQDFENLCRQVLATGEPYHVEDELNMVSRTPGGTPEPRYFSWSLYRVDMPGEEFKGILNVSVETTERKKAEEDLKKNNLELAFANKELESFSYSVSHDLRAPLRTLSGFSRLILDEYSDKLDETGKDYLNSIRDSSQNMATLIDDILRLSRVNRAEIYTQEVDLSEEARSIFAALKKSRPERQAEFVITPGLVVQGDHSLLAIALQNLLGNAWKFSDKLPQTRIEFGVTGQKGERVYFIKDNGVGFDMKYSDKLFQPFQRLHSAQEFEGSGIGLAIVQSVIRRHRGRVWAESEKGRGATFYFTLGH